MSAPKHPVPHPGVLGIDAYVPGRSEAPGAAKVFNSELSQRIASTGVNILGLYGGLRPESKKWSRLRGQFAIAHMVSLGITIAGGTSEIQRGIIAQGGLALPRG
jgi:alkylation response protein AidB-like acyl-CoA dehydrogenase